MTDIEISRSIKKEDIRKIAKNIGLQEEDLILYGNDKAKILKEPKQQKGKLILVTATNPTPYGEGKTTVSIGLGDALHYLNKNVVLALREPSMGPVFGMKGGATGGGYSQIVPMEDINLFFTGDMSAIEAANNLISAAIDNHIYFGNELGIEKVTFERCVDVNDRALREIETPYGKTSFTITAASEIMAILCLANDIEDLKKKVGNIVIGFDKNNNMIYAKDLKIEGAVSVILKDAIKPNLVQTLEHTPAIVHGGPFANIAHGCNSIIATKTALSLGDYVITEAGFGSDLGAEKFFDIKCRKANLKPDCVVLVTTIKALKYNANVEKENILKPNPKKVVEGLPNLEVHIENMKKFSQNVVVALNKYSTDSVEEIYEVENYCEKNKIPFAINEAYQNGGQGAIDLANVTLKVLEKDNQFKLLYKDNDSIQNKINKLAKEIYRAKEVKYSEESIKMIEYLEQNNLSKLPICVAKTQYSLSEDAKKLGANYDHTINVKNIKLYNGAGFIVIFLGNIITMPALSKKPNYLDIDLKNGDIVGLS
ncbi:MAG: formate--tetrahydrofolate ligase [Bacilli bacterium]|nr:formate--tetrahydrofolate ligase [Bacilli bacterium]